MDFLLSLDFLATFAGVAIGAIVFTLGAKVKGLNIIIKSLESGIIEYNNSTKPRPNHELIHVVNEKLPEKKKIKF